MREPWKTIIAIGAGLLVAVPLGYLWFYLAILASEIAGTDFPLRGTDLGIEILFLSLSFLFVPYSFVGLPLILAFLFRRAITSGNVLEALKSKGQMYFSLFAIGLVLGLSFWFSGTLIAD